MATIKCVKCGSLFDGEAAQTSNSGAKAAKTVLGAGAGGWLGSGIGIAMLGTAFAATLPLAALGALIMWATHKDTARCPACGQENDV